MMKLTIGLLAVLLSVSGSMAWELNSTETKKTWSYAAFQADKGGGVELQFYCDETYPDEIQMLVFTNTDARAGDAEFPSVSVDMVIDDVPFEELSGYYDDIDGERVVVVDTLEEPRVRDIITASRGAAQPLQVSYDGNSHRFGVTDASQVLTEFEAGCER